MWQSERVSTWNVVMTSAQNIVKYIMRIVYIEFSFYSAIFALILSLNFASLDKTEDEQKFYWNEQKMAYTV